MHAHAHAPADGHLVLRRAQPRTCARRGNARCGIKRKRKRTLGQQ
ncbi:hypothetical protein MYA_1952 [Burkholderia sp. KJ006]|nr:hypothetical protein MYA_1952 [Burkholderia sp. KJ006]